MLVADEGVRLNTTDFEVLDYLQDGRNVAPNVAAALDKDRNYVNNRLAHLHGSGLVRRIAEPGVERAGLYEITDRGRAAFENRGDYDRDEPMAFDELIERELADE